MLGIMEQDHNVVSITVVDLNKREINLKMVQSELIMELREFLADHINTCFFTNYVLEHQGNKLTEFNCLSDLDLDSDNKIYMMPQLYDEKQARNHIKRVTDILTKPCALNSHQKGQEEDEKKLSDLHRQAKSEGWPEEKLHEKL